MAGQVLSNLEKPRPTDKCTQRRASASGLDNSYELVSHVEDLSPKDLSLENLLPG
jgi:hypothetical protein